VNFVSRESQCFPKETKFTVPQGTSHYGICYTAKQMGQTGGKQMITLLTNGVQQRLTFRG